MEYRSPVVVNVTEAEFLQPSQRVSHYTAMLIKMFYGHPFLMGVRAGQFQLKNVKVLFSFEYVRSNRVEYCISSNESFPINCSLLNF